MEKQNENYIINSLSLYLGSCKALLTGATVHRETFIFIWVSGTNPVLEMSSFFLIRSPEGGTPAKLSDIPPKVKTPVRLLDRSQIRWVLREDGVCAHSKEKRYLTVNFFENFIFIGLTDCLKKKNNLIEIPYFYEVLWWGFCPDGAFYTEFPYNPKNSTSNPRIYVLSSSVRPSLINHASTQWWGW